MVKRVKKVNKVDPYGIPNVCFTIADSENNSLKQLKKWSSQRIKRGFDDTEVWDLTSTILKFIQPRLKVYMKGKGRIHGVPHSIASLYPLDIKGFSLALNRWKKVLKEIEWFINEEITGKEGLAICSKYILPIDLNADIEKQLNKRFRNKTEEKKYNKEMGKLNKRLEEGRKLFLDHLFDLWS